jgi:hypothetical protein
MFEVAAKTVISKVWDAPVEAASGERHGGYLNHNQFYSGDNFWIPTWGSLETRSVPLWWLLGYRTKGYLICGKCPCVVKIRILTWSLL